MSKHTKYAPGGDAQAIQRVAETYYGSYTNMFEAHGWPERSRKIMPSVQGHVVNTYGSVAAFEEAHKPDELMFPMEAIKADPPNVWLTGFWEFHPEAQGFLGFTSEARRRGFINGTKPGVLVVIYGNGRASKDEWGKVIGIQQCSHQLGHAEEFSAPAEWDKKIRDPDVSNRWNYAVKATRAWRVTPESRIAIRDFAPKAVASGAWQHIGSLGVSLSAEEAINILKLDLQEVAVYGGNPFYQASPGTAKEVFAPSKAGPVSQQSFTSKEAEGPKHLYILRLQGDMDAFLGKPANGRVIVKAGFSRSPQTRCDDHNRALPRCAFRWEVMHSGSMHNFDAYPSSDHAKAGERAMQEVLCREPYSQSLGGEFFLSDPAIIEEAWERGNKVAREYRK
ncbi:hypothetical protein [Paracoccus niistensis]|uniref:GIY-YIG nuclease family protein n=1 Tax=Paracoccus niistensis TaxID=632935 RepID=A0ABV6I3H5_9RHOB